MKKLLLLALISSGLLAENCQPRQDKADVFYQAARDCTFSQCMERNNRRGNTEQAKYNACINKEIYEILKSIKDELNKGK